MVFLIGKYSSILNPVSKAAARKLLRAQHAKVHTEFPFCLQLLVSADKANLPTSSLRPIQLRLDPGSITTGLVLAQKMPGGNWVLLWAAHLQHRGHFVQKDVAARKSVRSTRRNRKTWFRPMRSRNRARVKIYPSIGSRLDNIKSWFNRLSRIANITSVFMESNYDIATLKKHAVLSKNRPSKASIRENRVQSLGGVCEKTGAVDPTLHHIVPGSKNGSNHPSNFALLSNPENVKASNLPHTKAFSDRPDLVAKFSDRIKEGPKDQKHHFNVLNQMTWYLTQFFLAQAIVFFKQSGAKTKLIRGNRNLAKDHWVDAVCQGSDLTIIPKNIEIFLIVANSRGDRQVVRVDKFGFPRLRNDGTRWAAKVKTAYNYRSGDFVKFQNLRGFITIRAGGSFTFFDPLKKIGMQRSHETMKLLQRNIGYRWSVLPSTSK